MAEPGAKPAKRVKIGGNWQNLLLYLSNSTTDCHVLEFPDATVARYARNCICSEIGRHGSWYPLLITQRGSKIYVANTQRAQRVVIDENL
mgnify:CR=1 FL=1